MHVLNRNGPVSKSERYMQQRIWKDFPTNIIDIYILKESLNFSKQSTDYYKKNER